MIKLALGINHITVQGRLKGITLASMDEYTHLYVADVTPTLSVISPNLYKALMDIATMEVKNVIIHPTRSLELSLFGSLIVAKGDISDIINKGIFEPYQTIVNPSCVNIEGKHAILYKFITKLSDTYYIKGEDEQ